MKTIPVNFIGYGDWGSRLAKKVIEEGFTIENLVTERTNISINYNNLIKRKEIKDIDWTLPTFISTGPLHHHKILKYCKSRSFVEKPYYISGQPQTNLEFKPYVNYHWYNSLRLRVIKNFIGHNWKQLTVELYTTTRVDRGFSTLEDFLPHVVSIIKFLNPNVISSYKIIKISDDIYHIEFDYNLSKIIFKIGKSNNRYSRFKTENFDIKMSTHNIIEVNGNQYTLDRDTLKDSIHRYYNYYKTGSCEKIFYSDDFHKLILEIGNQNYE